MTANVASAVRASAAPYRVNLKPTFDPADWPALKHWMAADLVRPGDTRLYDPVSGLYLGKGAVTDGFLPMSKYTSPGYILYGTDGLAPRSYDIVPQGAAISPVTGRTIDVMNGAWETITGTETLLHMSIVSVSNINGGISIGTDTGNDVDRLTLSSGWIGNGANYVDTPKPGSTVLFTDSPTVVCLLADFNALDEPVRFCSGQSPSAPYASSFGVWYDSGPDKLSVGSGGTGPVTQFTPDAIFSARTMIAMWAHAFFKISDRSVLPSNDSINSGIAAWWLKVMTKGIFEPPEFLRGIT